MIPSLEMSLMRLKETGKLRRVCLEERIVYNWPDRPKMENSFFVYFRGSHDDFGPETVFLLLCSIGCRK